MVALGTWRYPLPPVDITTPTLPDTGAVGANRFCVLAATCIAEEWNHGWSGSSFFSAAPGVPLRPSVPLDAGPDPCRPEAAPPGVHTDPSVKGRPLGPCSRSARILLTSTALESWSVVRCAPPPPPPNCDPPNLPPSGCNETRRPTVFLGNQFNW